MQSLKRNNHFWHTRKTHNGNTEEPSRVKKCCDFAVGDTVTRTLPTYIRRYARLAKQTGTCEIESLLYITLVEASLTIQRFHNFIQQELLCGEGT
jgi:hypothetical protein